MKFKSPNNTSGKGIALAWAFCLVMFGVMYYLDSEQKDRFSTFEIEKKCNSNEFKYCTSLAKIYIDEDSPRKKVRNTLERACQNGIGGDAEGCGLLGDMFLTKSGEIEKGRKFMRYACHKGIEKFCEE